MKSVAHIRMLLLCVVLSLHSTLPCSAQTVPDCSRIITTAEKAKNGWTSFHDGRVTSVDLSGGLLGVELEGKHFAIYVTGSTEICNRGKTGALSDVKVGDRVGGMTKLVQGQAVAAIIGFGTVSRPSGIPVPGRKGWVLSPYAPSKPPINVSGIPHGGIVKCRYTGKLFVNPEQ